MLADLCTHNCNLSSWPGIVDVATEMLGAHDIIGPTIGLPSNDCDLRDSGLSICKQELCSIADDAIVLLVGTCRILHHHYSTGVPNARLG